MDRQDFPDQESLDLQKLIRYKESTLKCAESVLEFCKTNPTPQGVVITHYRKLVEDLKSEIPLHQSVLDNYLKITK